MITALTDIDLDGIALPGRKAFGTDSVLYPVGDPLTKKGAAINQYGAYLDHPGIHNGTGDLGGFSGDGLFRSFVSHQLFADDSSVMKAVMAAAGVRGLKPIHPKTAKSVDGALIGTVAFDWAEKVTSEVGR